MRFFHFESNSQRSLILSLKLWAEVLKTIKISILSGMNYWEVDLGRVYNIDHIMIYGRSDREQNWLNGASVSLLFVI